MGWLQQRAHVVTWVALLSCMLLCRSVACASAAEDSNNEDLASYAVGIRQTPMQSWGLGSAIYLGNGFVLTAAHVVGHAILTRPKVVFNGQIFDTETQKEGSFDGTDLTLLKIDTNSLPLKLRLRHIAICKAPPFPGQSVVTIAPGQTSKSVVISPTSLSPSVRRFSTVIRDVEGTGNSGSGVFDERQKCLLGIMSRKISEYRQDGPNRSRVLHDVAKYFVPANEITSFLPAGLVYETTAQ